MRIRITSTPLGEAPLEIREAWVGAEMDMVSYDEMTRAGIIGPATGIETRMPYLSLGVGGVVVSIENAIAALRFIGHREGAVWWWEQWHKSRAMVKRFIFDSSCFEEIN